MLNRFSRLVTKRANAPNDHTYQTCRQPQLVCDHVPIPPEASVDLPDDPRPGTCGAVFLPFGMAT